MNSKISLILGLFFLFVQENNAQNALLIASNEVDTGTDLELVISLDNSNSISALQFDVNYNADALVLQTGHLLTDRAVNHSLMVSTVSPGVARIVIFSIINNTISGASGSLLNLKFKTKTLPGDFTSSISNVVASSSTGSNITVDEASGTIKVLGSMMQIGVSELDFWQVLLGNNPTRNISIQNAGNQTLELTSITDINPFGIQEGFPISINPNSSKNLTVTLNTTAKGIKNAELGFQNNDTDSLRKSKTITLKAEVYAINTIRIGSSSGEIDTEVEIPVTVDNMEPFTGFQFDVVLPEGIEFVTGSITPSSRIDGHSIVASIVNGNKLRILGFSATNNNIIGNSGEVFSFKLKPKVASGYFPLQIENSILSNSQQGNILSNAYNGYISIKASNLYLDPTTISFGDVPITEIQKSVIRLHNYGDALLKINTFEYDATELNFDVSLPIEIQQGEFKDVTMSYTPNSVGSFSETVSFNHNGPSGQNILNVEANAFSPNFLMLRNQEGYKDSTNTFEILLKNNDVVRAIQFDVALPAGFIMDKDKISTTSRTESYTISSSKLDNNTFRIILYSITNSTISKGDTSIVNLPVFLEIELSLGDYQFSFSNVIISDINNQNISSAALESGTITIIDSTDPTITSTHPSQTVDAGSDCQSVLLDYTSDVIATDDSDTELTITQSPIAGTSITGETNEITLTATDNSGNSSSLSFNVSVVDRTDPTITSTHTDQSVDASNDCQSVLTDYTGDLTASDNCDSDLTITQLPVAGTAITGETNEITLTATDESGNSALVSFNVSVVDRTKPTISSTYTDQSIDADADCQASLADYTSNIMVTDNCDSELTVTQLPVAGTTITGETNEITLSATDDSGNSALVSFNISVVDRTDPTITGIIDASVDADGTNTYTVSGTVFDPVSTEDNCGVASVENDFNNSATLAGASLPIGVTSITWTVTDNSGNTNACSFNVTVNSTVGIESLVENGILMFPNPTNGKINLEFASIKDREMSISDLTGRTFLMTTLKSKKEIIDLSGFENGIYIISIQDDDKTLTARIMKQ